MEKARENDTFLTHEHMSTYTHEEKIYSQQQIRFD